jgi:TRAP-type transport system periplasmic protein
MNKKVVLISVVLVFTFLLIINAQSALASKNTYNWKISQPYPSGTMLFDLTEAFVERVKEESNGRINIKHYPGDLLGDYITQQESVQSGSHELAYTWPVSSINKKWDIAMIGYVGWNSTHGYEAYGPNGWMIPVLDDIAKECNWKIIGTAPLGTASGDSTYVISKQSYDPLNPEGKKCRVQPSKNYQIRFEAIGYNTITIPMSETSSALALGTIDASAGCVPSEFSIYSDSFTYAYLYANVLNATQLIINLSVWNSLSEEDQKILTEAADVSNYPEYDWGKWQDAVMSHYKEDLLPWQIIVVMDGDGWASLAEKAREAEWSYIENFVGKEVMDVIRENAEPLPWGLSVDEMNYADGRVLTTEWLIERQGKVYMKNPPPPKK